MSDNWAFEKNTIRNVPEQVTLNMTSILWSVIIDYPLWSIFIVSIYEYFVHPEFRHIKCWFHKLITKRKIQCFEFLFYNCKWVKCMISVREEGIMRMLRLAFTIHSYRETFCQMIENLRKMSLSKSYWKLTVHNGILFHDTFCFSYVKHSTFRVLLEENNVIINTAMTSLTIMN
jgi:hypothetical protein